MLNESPNTSPPSLSNSVTIFEFIYTQALTAKSASELRQNLNDCYLDVIHPQKLPLLTPAGQLAADGEFAAAELLRQLGANVNYIVLGLASQNHHNQVEEYRLKHNALVKHIVEGYIFARNPIKVNEYRQVPPKQLSRESMARTYAMIQDGEQIQEYKDLNINLLEGYAMAGLMDELIPHLSNASIDTINRVAAAFAMSGRYDLVCVCISQYKANDYKKIIRHCIRAGHDEGVDYFCNRFKEQVDFTEIASTYARMGNHKQVVKYINTHNAPKINVLWVYIYQEYHQFVEALRIDYKINPDTIACLYAEAVETDKVEEYRIQHKVTIETILTGYNKVAKKSLIPTFYRRLLKLQEIPGEISVSIQKQLISLKSSSTSCLNFFGSSNNHQIALILAALRDLNDTASLENAFNDKNSALYQATNPSCLFTLLNFTPPLISSPSFNTPFFAKKNQTIAADNCNSINCKKD